MNASNFVEGVDFSLYLILGISVVFLVGITAVMIYFLFRYRKKNNPVATNIEGSHTLEIIWTVVPTLLVLVMFWYGWTGYEPMLKAPKDAIEIDAIGQMWKWTFVYPDGKTSDSLVIPVNEPVKLNLKSADVLHSLYIPAFRVKQDVVPGGGNWMWFTGQLVGKYDILCAEYCGQLHSYMMTSVNVVERPDYDVWLTTKEDTSNEHPGFTLLKKNACTSCHTTDGTRLVGPSFKGIMGKNEVVIIDGENKEITVTREYVIESMKQPNAAIVESYLPNLMISYENIISDEDMHLIVDYLETLK